MADARARALRKCMTPQEVKLWQRLRTLRPLGFHFRRQAPRKGFIVDFACLRHRLIVEVDGGQHGLDDGLGRDAERDRRLAAAGFRVMRFWNSDIDGNLDGVVETIVGAMAPDVAGPTRPAAPATLPEDGEGEALGRRD
jgi:very-short-patch-repair endonuclease